MTSLNVMRRHHVGAGRPGARQGTRRHRHTAGGEETRRFSGTEMLCTILVCYLLSEFVICDLWGM